MLAWNNNILFYNNNNIFSIEEITAKGYKRKRDKLLAPFMLKGELLFNLKLVFYPYIATMCSLCSISQAIAVFYRATSFDTAENSAEGVRDNSE